MIVTVIIVKNLFTEVPFLKVGVVSASPERLQIFVLQGGLRQSGVGDEVIKGSDASRTSITFLCSLWNQVWCDVKVARMSVSVFIE
jgi:hypothetical protein